LLFKTEENTLKKRWEMTLEKALENLFGKSPDALGK